MTDHAEYHGQAIRQLANEHLWVDVLATAGPRIVRLGLAASGTNVLAETPADGWETPHGRYELYGGHRLWFAPEDPDLVAVPDGSGVTIEPDADGLRLTGRTEPPTGLVRSIAIGLDPRGPGLDIRHELRNVGRHALELAPWAITQLPLGGTVLLPEAAVLTGHHVRPNRRLVLWPYSSWEDPRFAPLDGLITVRATPGPNLKIGTFNDAGWTAYAREGTVLVRRFDPLPGQPHPDLGCNVEVYVGARYAELEVLGPLERLEPGATATLIERWDLLSVAPPAGDPDPRLLAELVARSLRARGDEARLPV